MTGTRLDQVAAVAAALLRAERSPQGISRFQELKVVCGLSLVMASGIPYAGLGYVASFVTRPADTPHPHG